MSTNIHPTAVVSDKATIGDNVTIGPYSIVGDEVKLGNGVELKSHVVIEGNTEVGDETVIYPFASIGMIPQDKKFAGENSRLIIGKRNRIREYVTMQPGTESGGLVTRVGDDGLFMAGAHVAHDCIIGNNVILCNHATLAGHVEMGDHSYIGGLAAVHQFVHIGHHAFIGGMAGIKNDVIPYALVMGRPANLSGLNIVGLKRGGASGEEIRAMMRAYDRLFDRDDLTLAERIEDVKITYADDDKVMDIVDFMAKDTARPMCLPAAS
ncbi:MAG: acyl-ACP--UDP-N-acetylglucosamine O-acyltransferase [Alphaproteobacteria bacterium]